MNILVIAHYGLCEHISGSFVYNQAREYAAKGHRVRMLIPVPMGKNFQNKKIDPRLYKTRAEGMELYYMRFLSISNYGRKHFNAKSAIVSLYSIKNQVFDCFVPDVVHAHTLGLDSRIGGWVKSYFYCPLVVTTHGSDTEKPLARGERTELCAYCAQADRIVAVSSALKNRLQCCGTKVAVDVILNGFVSKYVEPREKKPLSIIQVGHLIPSKRTEITIRAFAQLRQVYPEMTLKVIGEGVLRQSLELLASELGVKDAITFTGQIPNHEVFAAMAEASYFVMASKPEGFGVVYLEAMANGCITVGTEGEGIADLIESGKNGFLVTPDDPDAIVRVIDRCIQDPQWAREIARQGYDDAVGLTWERNAAEYISLFESLLKQNI